MVIVVLLSSHEVLAQAQPPVSPGIHVRSGFFPYRLRQALDAQGDRLVKPGKERMVVSGNFSGASGAGQFVLIRELPGLFRLQVNGSGVPRSFGFDGTQLWSTAGPIIPADSDLIESLVQDCAEHFFTQVSGGAAMRILGYFFRTDNGRAPNYSGPFYHIVQIVARPGATPGPARSRLYLINAQTGLLD
ncbi:MAG: hypothetical protein ACREUU_19020, partial [Gammaproteobacteria bacterium]